MKIDTSGWVNNRDSMKIKEMKEEISRNLDSNVRTIKGAVMELQRITSKKSEFDKSTYTALDMADEAIKSLINELKLKLEEAEYTIDIIESLKASQQLTDGYKEYVKEKQSFNNLNYFDEIYQKLNTMPAKHTFIDPNAPMIKFDKNTII